MRSAVDNAHGSVRRIIELAEQSGCKPISLMAPRFGLVDLINGNVGSFLRAGSVVRKDRRTIPANWPAVSDGYNLIEPAATSYYWQSCAEVNGINATTEAPPTRTVSLPVGSYVLWCEGNSGLSVAIAAGTAVGSGFGSISAGGSIALTITSAGTVVVMPSNGVVGDIVQLHSGSWRHSFIPTPTSSPVTAASAGADTSGNGLSVPLSQAMIDSLKGEMIDWSTAGVFSNGGADSAYVTVTAAEKKIKVVPTDHSVYWGKTSTLEIGATYESSVTISGFNSGAFYIGYGSTSGNQRTSNGTYVERFTATGNTSIFFRGITNSDFTVTINYVRRVLDSGQTNPGEGTVLCGVYLPWASNMPVTTTNILSAQNSTAAGTLLYLAGTNAHIHDGVNFAGVLRASFGAAPGACILVSQYSAALGRMRVGLYNPATGVLTWGNYAAYRGFFPIYGTGSQQRLRGCYGLTGFPLGICHVAWLNGITPDAYLTQIIQEASRL